MSCREGRKTQGNLKGQFTPNPLKSHFPLSTYRAIYLFRLLWCELLSFGDIRCRMSNIMELDGTRWYSREGKLLYGRYVKIQQLTPKQFRWIDNTRDESKTKSRCMIGFMMPLKLVFLQMKGDVTVYLTHHNSIVPHSRGAIHPN